MRSARAQDLPIIRQPVHAHWAWIRGQFASRRSAELWVLVGPGAAFRYLAGHHNSVGTWTFLRRPLLLATLIGCTLSLGTSGVLTARLVFSTAATWSFVPLFEIGSLLIVCWPRRRAIPLSRAVDLFCCGHGPWIVVLLGLGAILSWMSPIKANTLSPYFWGAEKAWPFWIGITAWSAYLDYFFFRVVMQHSSGQAARTLFLQRAIAWTCGIAYLFAYPLWPLMVGWLRR